MPQVLPATAFGRTVVKAADAAALRALQSLGTVALLASDADTALAADSDAKIATQRAVKHYVDNAVTGLLDIKGATDCSANPNYPAASKGDAYLVSVAGKIGGASGKDVDIGDWYVATADNAGGTEASVGTSWTVFEHNLSGVALTSGKLSQFAATTSAELAGVLSDETGDGGGFVRANNATLVAPALGTPASGALTNCTSIPAAQLTGSIADARLSSNVPLKDAANTFTADQSGDLLAATDGSGRIGYTSGATLKRHSINAYGINLDKTGAPSAGYFKCNSGASIIQILAGYIRFGSSARLCSASNPESVGEDIGLIRSAAGVWSVNDGSLTAANYRDLLLRTMTASAPVIVGVYTFATVPAASSYTGGAIRISDRAQRWAYSDGTNWKFFADDANIS